jgi:hypothetical protein
MNINCTSSSNVLHNISPLSLLDGQNSFKTGCSHLVSSEKNLLGALPDLQAIKSNFFAAQRRDLPNIASSSNSQHVVALSINEERLASPSSNDGHRLEVPFTGKGLVGGMPRGGYASNRATLEVLYSQRDSLEEQKNGLQEQIDFWTHQRDDLLDNADMYDRQENHRAANQCRNRVQTHTNTIAGLERQKATVQRQINRVQAAIDNM